MYVHVSFHELFLYTVPLWCLTHISLTYEEYTVRGTYSKVSYKIKLRHFLKIPPIYLRNSSRCLFHFHLPHSFILGLILLVRIEFAMNHQERSYRMTFLSSLSSLSLNSRPLSMELQVKVHYHIHSFTMCTKNVMHAISHYHVQPSYKSDLFFSLYAHSRVLVLLSISL